MATVPQIARGLGPSINNAFATTMAGKAFVGSASLNHASGVHIGLYQGTEPHSRDRIDAKRLGATTTGLALAYSIHTSHTLAVVRCTVALFLSDWAVMLRSAGYWEHWQGGRVRSCTGWPGLTCWSSRAEPSTWACGRRALRF